MDININWTSVVKEVEAVIEKATGLHPLLAKFSESVGNPSGMPIDISFDFRLVVVSTLPSKESKREPEFYHDSDLYDLDLKIRASNAIWNHGIQSVKELVSMTERDLAKIRNLGKKGRQNIKERLHAKGLKLRAEFRK